MQLEYKHLHNAEEILRVFDENYDHKTHYHEYWAAGIEVMFGILAKHIDPFKHINAAHDSQRSADQSTPKHAPNVKYNTIMFR